MQLIKRLTQTLSAGSTSLTFTDSMINNNSVIEVYADSIEVYPTALSQSGTSVTVQFDEQQAAHSILLLINNIVSLSDPTLATLLDVDLGTLNEEDILTYDETAEKWVNAGARTAEDIAYDNTDSGLEATDVQAAIDELAQSGGGRTVIVLWTGDKSTTGAISLSDSFLNFDEIELIWGANRTENTYLKSIRFNVSDINTTIFAQYGDNWFSNTSTYCLWAGHFTQINEFTIDNIQSSSQYAPVHVYKLRGIKY